MKIKSIIATTLLTLVLVGCGIQQDTHKLTNNEQQTSLENTTVKIAMVTFPGYAPLYLANEKNLWGEGIDVELIRIESVGDMRAALQAKQIDIYAGTLDMYLAAKGNEPAGIGFMAMLESQGGDGIAVDKSIQTIADLKGKTIAAEAGYPPHFILMHLLYEQGMTLEDIDRRDIPSSEAVNAFIANRVDAVGTYEPFLSTAINGRQDSKILISSADTPGLVGDQLWAHPDLIKQQPEVLESVAQGRFNAIQYIQSQPKESHSIMGEAFGVSMQEMKEFSKGIKRYTQQDNINRFSPTSEVNIYKTYKRVQDILVQNGEEIFITSPYERTTGTIISNR